MMESIEQPTRAQMLKLLITGLILLACLANLLWNYFDDLVEAPCESFQIVLIWFCISTCLAMLLPPAITALFSNDKDSGLIWEAFKEWVEFMGILLSFLMLMMYVALCSTIRFLRRLCARIMNSNIRKATTNTLTSTIALFVSSRQHGKCLFCDRAGAFESSMYEVVAVNDTIPEERLRSTVNHDRTEKSEFMQGRPAYNVHQYKQVRQGARGFRIGGRPMHDSIRDHLLAKLDDKDLTIRELRNGHEDNEARIARLNERSKDDQANIAQLNARIKELEDLPLQKRVQVVEAELVQEKAASGSRCAGLRMEVDAQRYEVDVLKAKLAAERDLVTDLKEAVETITKVHDERLEAYDGLQDDYNSALVEMEVDKRALAKTHADVKELQDEIDEADARLEQGVMDEGRLEQENKALKARLAAAEDKPGAARASPNTINTGTQTDVAVEGLWPTKAQDLMEKITHFEEANAQLAEDTRRASFAQVSAEQAFAMAKFELTASQKVRDEMSTYIRSLQEDLAAKQQSQSAMQYELERAQTALALSESRENELQETRRELANTQEMLRESTSAKEWFENYWQQEKGCRENNGNLLTRCNDELCRTREERDRYKAEVESLRQMDLK